MTTLNNKSVSLETMMENNEDLNLLVEATLNTIGHYNTDTGKVEIEEDHVLCQLSEESQLDVIELLSIKEDFDENDDQVVDLVWETLKDYESCVTKQNAIEMLFMFKVAMAAAKL